MNNNIIKEWKQYLEKNGFYVNFINKKQQQTKATIQRYNYIKLEVVNNEFEENTFMIKGNYIQNIYGN